MAYLKNWRRRRAEVLCLANSSPDEENSSVNEDTLPLTSLETDFHVADLTTRDESTSEFETDLEFISSDNTDIEDVRNDTHNGEHYFPEELASWATKNQLSRSALGDLLSILRREGHDLPKDPRTLLRTPRSINIIDKCGGQYIYLGIESRIIKLLERNPDLINDSGTLKLLVNVDGVPLFKSTSDQFWPILISIKKYRPLLVALFYGKSKPVTVDDFLEDFLEEFSVLKENGVTYKTFTVAISAFVCDAPARAYLKCTKGHTGYYACERCEIRGERKENRITFDTSDPSSKRTDIKFNQEEYRGTHQIGRTPLIRHNFSCVSRFPLDFMHLGCLGVVRRTLIFLKRGPRLCRLSRQQIKNISDTLERLAGKIPSEFARQPRTLDELERWKATEFRQFLLYTGLVALKGVLTTTAYKHFVIVFVACTILCDSNDKRRNHYLQYARDLLKLYVDKSRHIYGSTFVVYNVHSLVHVADDATKFNCSLNDLSAFPFENYLQTLKYYVRNSKNPTAQVVKRIEEIEWHNNEENLTSGYRYINKAQRQLLYLEK